MTSPFHKRRKTAASDPPVIECVDSERGQNHHNNSRGSKDDDFSDEETARFSPPEGYEEVSCKNISSTLQKLLSTIDDDSELWLIRAPTNCDISTLEGSKVAFQKRKRGEDEDIVGFAMKGDKKIFEAHHEPFEHTQYVPVLPDTRSGKYSLVQRGFSRLVELSEIVCSEDHATHPVAVDVPARIPPSQPEGLKLHYIPFGATASTTKKKAEKLGKEKKKSKKSKEKEVKDEKPAKKSKKA
eukprot:TRINITY_DN20883_c0_g1::TRINITY_DN20883_c0_g1_i1::g.12419::m.12419 TRINITY_DN20883_c0_g1::TRINITY_DN20883_c0_g1_i1::g.12419  ORF type:complete len:241 (-),score=23.26,RNA_polI_A34/PF08208.6/3.1e-16 TRINITY_DN20883_c0_g1_i1:56-778(-)